MTDSQVAVVTGISSGIGKATAAELARRGFRVFGTVRAAGAAALPGVEEVVLDVRDEASVERGVAEVLGKAGRIDVLINNAGTSIVGAIEETDTAQARELFDVNFFGAVRMTRAVLPAMRARRAGRLLYVSSVVGFLPAPFMGFYSASKHALEGYAESLEHETRTLGIRVALIEPGSMRTNADKSATLAEARIADYAEAFERVWASASAHQRDGEDPAVVAKAVLRAATERTPRLRYPVGKGASLLAKLRSFMPAGVFSRSLRRAFRVDA